MTTEPANRTSVPQATRTQYDYLLLDASSSMTTKWHDSLAALDGYIHGLKEANINSTITMATFSQGSTGMDYIIERETSVRDWTPLTESRVPMSGGGTPLYDAINTMVRELRDLDPPKCSIVIVTDGEDYDSKTTVDHAKAILNWCKAKGWQVTFIGCDFNNLATAKQLGVDSSNAIGVSQKRLADVASSLAKKRAAYGHYGTSMSFSDAEKENFGGYLAPPTT